MLSAWTDVFQVPGKRTTGDKAQTYLITGPGWSGQVPAGLKQLKAPTNLVWIIGRTYCTGTPEDYKAVHAIQDKYSVVPLSAYGKPYTPPPGKVDPSIDMKTAVRDQVNALSAGDYFKLMAALMKDNPPAKADAPMVAKMKKLGIEPGKDFDIARLDPGVAKALQGVPKAGVERIMNEPIVSTVTEYSAQSASSNASLLRRCHSASSSTNRLAAGIARYSQPIETRPASASQR